MLHIVQQNIISLYSLFVSKPIVNMVIAEFIFGSESVEAIVEPLKIVQTWNSSWNPSIYHQLLGCRNCCSRRCVSECCCIYMWFPLWAGLDKLRSWMKVWFNMSWCWLALEMLRDCAWASSGEKGALDYHYQQAVVISNLEKSYC